MREKALMAVYCALVALAGAGILVVSGILLSSAEERALKRTAVDFAARAGVAGDARRDVRAERGPVERAFAFDKKGKPAGYVLLLEGRGLSGEARFLGAYAVDGSFKSSSPIAFTDAWPAKHGWPADDASAALMEAAEGDIPSGLVEGMEIYDAETEIFLSAMGKALTGGRQSIIRARSATR